MRAGSPPGSPLRTGSWRQDAYAAGSACQRVPQVAYSPRIAAQPHHQPVFGGHLSQAEAMPSFPTSLGPLGAVSSDGFTFPARAPPVMEQISGRNTPPVMEQISGRSTPPPVPVWQTAPAVELQPRLVRPASPCAWRQPTEPAGQPALTQVLVTETVPAADNAKSMTLLNRLDSVIAEMEMVLAPGRLPIPAEYRAVPVPVEFRPGLVRGESPVPQSAFLQDPSRRSRSQEMRSQACMPGLYMESTASRSASTPPRQEAQQSRGMTVNRLSADGRKTQLTELKSIIAKCQSLSGSAVAPPHNPLVRGQGFEDEILPTTVRSPRACTPLQRQRNVERYGVGDVWLAQPASCPDVDRVSQASCQDVDRVSEAGWPIGAQRGKPQGTERSGSVASLLHELNSFHEERVLDSADSALQMDREQRQLSELRGELDEANRKAHTIQLRCVEEEASQEAALSARLYAWEAKAATLQRKCDLLQKQEAEASSEMSELRRMGLNAESNWREAQTSISALRAEADAAVRRAKAEETSKADVLQRELYEAQRRGSAGQAEAMAEKDQLIADAEIEKRALLERALASEGAVQSLQVQVAEAVDRTSAAQTGLAQKDLDLVSAAEQEQQLLGRLAEETAKVEMLELELSEAWRQGSAAQAEALAAKDQLIADTEREKGVLLERVLASEAAVQSLQVQVAEGVDRTSVARTDLAQKDLALVTAVEQEESLLQRLSEETGKVELLELELAEARREGSAVKQEALAEKDQLLTDAGREKELLLSRIRASEGALQGLQLEVEGALDQSSVAQRDLVQKDLDLAAAAEQEEKLQQRLAEETSKVKVLELELVEARRQDVAAHAEVLAQKDQLLEDAAREKEQLLERILASEGAVQSLQVQVAEALDQSSTAQRDLTQKDLDLVAAAEQEEKLLQRLSEEAAKVKTLELDLSESQRRGSIVQVEVLAQKDQLLVDAAREKEQLLERILASEGAVQSLQVQVAEAFDQRSVAQRDLAQKDLDLVSAAEQEEMAVLRLTEETAKVKVLELELAEARRQDTAAKEEALAEKGQLMADAGREKAVLLGRIRASEGAIQGLQVEVAGALDQTTVAQRELAQKDLDLVSAAEQEERLLRQLTEETRKVETLQLELSESQREGSAAQAEVLAQKNQLLTDAEIEKTELLERILANEGQVQGLQVQVAEALDQRSLAQRDLAQKDLDLVAAAEQEEKLLKRLTDEAAKVEMLELELLEARRQDAAAQQEVLAKKDQLIADAGEELARRDQALVTAAEQEEKLLQHLSQETAKVEMLELELVEAQRQALGSAAQAEVLVESHERVRDAEREREELQERILANDGALQSLQVELAEARDQRNNALQDLAQKDRDLVTADVHKEMLLQRISAETAQAAALVETSEAAALRVEELSEAQRLEDSAQQLALAEKDLLLAGAQREKDELLDRVVASDGAVRQLEEVLVQRDLDIAGATAEQDEKLMQLVTEEAARVELAQIELLEAQRQDRESQQEAATLRVELAEALAQRDSSRRESRARNSTAAELAQDTLQMQSQIAQLTEMLKEQNEEKKALQSQIDAGTAAQDELHAESETKAATFDAEYAAMLAEGMKKDAQLMRQQTEIAEFRSRLADLAVQQARMSRASRLSAIDHGYFDEGDMHQIPIPPVARELDPLERGSQAGASSVRSSHAEDLGVFEDAQLVSLRPSSFSGGLQHEQIRSSFVQGSGSVQRPPGGASVGAISGNMSDDGSETWDTGAEDLAIPEAYLEVIKQVDEYGWDSMEWSHGYTLLHWAAKNNYGSLCVRFMAQKADPELRDDRGESAMDYAAEFGSRRALAQLEKGSIMIPHEELRPIDPLMTTSYTRTSMQVQANPTGSRVIPGAVHFEDLTSARGSGIRTTTGPLPTVEAVDD